MGSHASNQPIYDQTRASVLTQAERVWNVGGRAALTVYSGNSIWHPVAACGSGFGDTRGLLAAADKSHFICTMNTAVPQNHLLLNAVPQLSIYPAAYFSTESLPWQYGASKAIVYVIEKPLYHEYGYRYLASKNMIVTHREFLIRRTLEIDPVSVYFVVGNDEAIEEAEYIAKATAGQVRLYDPSDPESLDQAIAAVQDDIIERPTVVFGNETYYVQDGQPASFDVSRSRANESAITKYDWDYDGDGNWDKTTIEPYSSHQYPDGHEGLIHVQATDSRGRIGSMTANIVTEMIEAPKELPLVENVRYEILSTEGDQSVIRLIWDPVDPAVPYIVLSIDGVHHGRMDNSRTTIDITEIRRGADVAIDLQMMDEDYTLGGRSGVVVPAIPSLVQPDLKKTQALLGILEEVKSRYPDEYVRLAAMLAPYIATRGVDTAAAETDATRSAQGSIDNDHQPATLESDSSWVRHWPVVLTGATVVIAGVVALLCYRKVHRQRGQGSD